MAVIRPLLRPQVDGGRVLSENGAGTSQSEVRFCDVRCSRELEKLEADGVLFRSLNSGLEPVVQLTRI